ncbi:MAG: AfsR/SARP family transcriptional regulator, partial [Acidimicrobiia bacterium]
MRFRVLGPTEAQQDEAPLPVGGPKQRTVLALLIAHAGEPVTTDFLVDQAYRGEPPSGGRRTVQTLVSNLRAELGDAITSMGHGYQLNADRSEVDAFVFEDTVRDAKSADNAMSAT